MKPCIIRKSAEVKPNVNSLFKQIKRAQKVIEDDKSSAIYSQTDIFGNPIKEGVDEKFSNFKANEPKFQKAKDSLVNLSEDSDVISTINNLAESLSPGDYTLNKQIESELLKQFVENLLVKYNVDKDSKDNIIQFLNAENYDLAEALIEGATVRETVEVTAPNGKPSKAFEALYNKFGDEQTALRAYVNMYTDEFQSWFKDSVVVDANGEPKVLYLDLKNEDGSVFVLGENLTSNIPMFVSSTNPTINEDGNYVITDLDEIQDAFNGYKEEDYYDYSPVQDQQDEFESQASGITTLALSETEIFRQQKQTLYYNVKERLNKINDRLKKIEEQLSIEKNIKKEEYDKIKNRYKKLLSFQLKSEKLLLSYSKDLQDLKQEKDEAVIRELIDKDFDRLNDLINKKALTASEYSEAKTLITFFRSLFPEKNKLHPLFSDEALFDGGEIKLEKSLLDYFIDLSNKAGKFNNKLVNQRNTLVTAIVNSNVKVKNLNDVKLEYEEIVKTDEGLEDTHWFDAALMDASMGVFSDNGIIPQVAISEISLSTEQKLIESEKTNKKIDKLQPAVEKVLREKGQSLNFLLVPGVSYNMFKQKDQYGLETGNIVTRYSTKFSEEKKNIEDIFETQMSIAEYELDPNTRSKKMNLAANKRQNWYRENTIQVDVRKLPKILDDPEFAEFAEFFDKTGSQEHENELKENMSVKAYNEMVIEQKKKLLGYLRKRKILFESKGVKWFADWDRKNNPFIANAYFYENIKINHETDTPSMEYNVHVPRKNKSIVTVSANNKLNFGTSTKELNFYDQNFKEIEENSTLYEFHKELLSILKRIRNHFPPHLQERIDLNTVMSVDKTITEAVLESSSKFDAFSKVAGRAKQGFKNAISGKLVESIDSKIDTNKINDSFIQNNYNEISRLESISTTMLEQALGIDITKFTKIHASTPFIKKEKLKIQKTIDTLRKNLEDPNITPEIKKTIKKNLKANVANLKKIITYDDLASNVEAIKVLSDLLGVNETIDDIKNKLNNETVILQPLLKKAATNEIARQKSFDLPRIMKYYSSLAAKYQAKNENKIIQDILKSAYQDIKTPKGSKRSKTLTENEAHEGLSNIRERAIKQYDSWYNRVILDSQGKPIEEIQKVLDLSEEKKIKRFFKILKGIFTGKIMAVLNKEEKSIKKKIDKILKEDAKRKSAGEKGLSPSKINELKEEKENLGNRISIGSLFSGLLAYTRLKSLGYSIRSSVTNRMEGVISNNLISALGYISYDNYLRSVRIARKSFKKNITFGKYKNPEAVKVTTIMNKLQKIQDSANELQKSSVKSSYSKLGTYLNPYELNKRVEFLNQSTLIVGSLLDTKIKDKDGKESNVFDALNPDGTLKSQFKSGPDAIKNINNWELFIGNEYKNWSAKTEGMINLAHGNYSELRGMMAKDSPFGKAALMFKTWMPMAIASRFATEQENIILGKKKFKGRYRSYTAPATAINSTLLGFGVAGVATGGLGVAIGAGLATGASATLMRNYLFNRQKKLKGELKDVSNNVATDLGMLQESAFVVRTLLAKAIGLPINRMFSGISSEYFNKSTVLSEKFMGDYLDKLNGENFTKEDALNMNANMTEAALLTQRLMIMAILARIIMSSWETEDEELRPGYYNYVINQLQNLNSNILSLLPYVSNIGQHSDIGKLPVFKTGREISEAVGYGLHAAAGFTLSKIFQNPELKNGLLFYNQIQNGKNSGDYYLSRSLVKLAPGAVKDFLQFYRGDEPAPFKETFIGNPFDMLFETNIQKIRRDIKAKRRAKKTELMENGKSEMEATKIANSIFKLPPDPFAKKKKILKDRMGR